MCLGYLVFDFFFGPRKNLYRVHKSVKRVNFLKLLILTKFGFLRCVCKQTVKEQHERMNTSAVVCMTRWPATQCTDTIEHIKQQKKLKHMARNRKSAKESRFRRLQHLERLEATVLKRTLENTELRAEISRLEEENNVLKCQEEFVHNALNV